MNEFQTDAIYCLKRAAVLLDERMGKREHLNDTHTVKNRAQAVNRTDLGSVSWGML